MRLGDTVVSIEDVVKEGVIEICCVVDEDLVDIPSSDVVVKNSIGVVDLVDVVGGDGDDTVDVVEASSAVVCARVVINGWVVVEDVMDGSEVVTRLGHDVVSIA